MKEKAAQIIDLVRQQNPLIHCITNYVTINDCANILLAFGAAPAMVEMEAEARGFAQISSALYLNLGTYTPEQEQAGLQAVAGAGSAQRPIVLDPVGCGAIPRKAQLFSALQNTSPLSIIKGNMGEIMALAGKMGQGRGVDSDDDIPGIEEAAIKLAQRYECVVAATGKTDVVTDGKRLVRLNNGVDMLKTITGAGCMVGALCTACAAVCGDKQDMLAAAVAGISAMSIAAELAYEKAQLPGSFRMALIDSIYQLKGETLLQRGKLDVE